MWAIPIVAIIVIFLAVILIRALAFKPGAQPSVDETPVEFDKERATEALRTLVRCKTVSYRDPALEDGVEFENGLFFEHFLLKLRPQRSIMKHHRHFNKCV